MYKEKEFVPARYAFSRPENARSVKNTFANRFCHNKDVVRVRMIMAQTKVPLLMWPLINGIAAIDAARGNINSI